MIASIGTALIPAANVGRVGQVQRGLGALDDVAGAAGLARAAKGTTDFIEGRLGGALYDPVKLGRLEGYLGRRGITLQVGDEFLPLGKAGGFDAVNRRLALRSNPTKYEVWHELSHYNQFKKLGPDAYSAQTRVMKEQYVFDALENTPKRWNALNADQRQHAIDYILFTVGGIR